MPRIKKKLIPGSYTGNMCLVSLALYDKEQLSLPVSQFTDDIPTGIACPRCKTELYANRDIHVKENLIPAWCTDYFCGWRGVIHVYEKDTA